MYANAKREITYKKLGILNQINRKTEKSSNLSLEPRSARRGRILLAEDGPQMRELVSQCLAANGFEIVKCGNGHNLIDLIDDSNDSKSPFDLVISDVRMPGTTAIRAIDGVKVGAFPPTILMSAFGDDDLKQAASSRGVMKFFDKPFELDELIDYVNEFFKKNGKL